MLAPGARTPRKQPQQARSRETVEKILTAAAKVFLEEGTRATTDRIAARAGVSVGSLYQYFPNKDALLLELAHQHVASAGEKLDGVLGADHPMAIWLPEAVRVVAAIHADGALHRLLYSHAATNDALVEAFGKLDLVLRERVQTLLEAEGTFAEVATTAQTLVALVESLAHRLTGAMELETLVREVTAAASAYIESRRIGPTEPAHPDQAEGMTQPSE
ncbi:MAG: helix-turn-helix domain-containing protein [Propionibacteriaceae bacterium]|nr:helix-turn-helix domain-containing protein [Propionibacteriaceae bacterium]